MDLLLLRGFDFETSTYSFKSFKNEFYIPSTHSSEILFFREFICGLIFL